MQIYKPLLFLILAVTCFRSVIFAQNTEPDAWLLEQKLPSWSVKMLKSLKLDSVYRLSDFINPFYLQSDFNGDAKNDIAIAVQHATSKKKGVLILHQLGKNFVIGAGKDFGNGGDNFDWMDVWKVYFENSISPGVGEAKTVALKTSAIYVAKSESSSAVIYWSGNGYKWHQQGD